MGNQWDDKSWQKDFLNMKSHALIDSFYLAQFETVSNKKASRETR